jgi:hypothetical protein
MSGYPSFKHTLQKRSFIRDPLMLPGFHNLEHLTMSVLFVRGDPRPQLKRPDPTNVLPRMLNLLALLIDKDE